MSAMTAMTASVSPNCQETRIENANRIRTATTMRSCQTRILGFSDKRARSGSVAASAFAGLASALT